MGKFFESQTTGQQLYIVSRQDYLSCSNTIYKHQTLCTHLNFLFPDITTLKHYLGFITNNRMTISDYNTKPIRGDRGVILKLHRFTCNSMGSLEIARVHLK